ncbi:hypothetical protein PHLCEN_2v13037 [Hermanssonia centrifuga]|uniref:Peptidase A1 domain-containing protein n=1 Tax=Hermanssonia centrifuga TaxID=98765 RepID=A0A2R6NFN1_9APHY|nr:hypothetical protein PHLCEN_2v13037 [Hermanssonia centrifuga]
MFSRSPLLIALTLALVVSANPLTVRDAPLVTLPIAKRVNTTSTTSLLKHDQARARGLIARANARLNGKRGPSPDTIVGSTPATDQIVDYVVTINIGSPPTAYTLLVDSGSSNTWVGAMQLYVQTSTSVETRNSVEVIYNEDEFFSGTEFTDHISFGSELIVFGQSIGAATESAGFDDSDGVLGLGPTDLTIGTLTPDTATSIPTVTDNLFAQAVITQNQVAISFEPSSEDGAVNGEVTWGGTDSSKFTGSINFAPITSTSPSNQYWGFNQQIRYGTSTNILSNTAGIVDTGTTLTLIATDALTRYTDANGAVFDDTTGLFQLTLPQFANLQSLFFTINGVTVEFTANAQIWPRALNTAIGGDTDHVYLIIGDIGSDSGSGMDFINGMTWVERFYVVLDTTNQKVGVANTPFTRATTN